jgi:hypothetical protein
MTNNQKFGGIKARLAEIGEDLGPEHISVMVIIGYLNKLDKLGVIESAFKVPPLGQSVVSICEEFDWKPADKEIEDFVNEMVEPVNRAGFLFLLKRYRDDREKMTEEIKRAKLKSDFEL